MEKLRFDTLALHGTAHRKDHHNSLRFPVYAGVAFDFETAEDMEDAFCHRKPSHAYSRITNPSVECFEQTLNQLENGLGAIALSSGMAAITNALLALLDQGDNIIASKYLFGNTCSLLKETFKGYGIDARFVDVNNPAKLEQAIDKNTRVIFCETITNPQMNVSDFSVISKIAQKYDLVLIVDNTVTTPYLFDAKAHGVNVVIHSTTKYISGGATSVGGAIVDLENFDWSKIPALGKYHHLSHFSFLARLRKEVYRNFGSCMSPQAANFQMLGLETLSLRVSRSCENALVIAQFLESQKNIRAVYYPGIESSEYYLLAKSQFNPTCNGIFAPGGVLSFECENQEAAFRVLNRLNLIKRATNLNDNKSLIIHPASTIFSDFTTEEKNKMRVTQGLIRLSVGIENIEDLLEDIRQAIR